MVHLRSLPLAFQLMLPSLYLAQDASASGPGCQYTVGAPVKTTSGTVYGHRAPNATEVSEYLGIPYALPPVGQLRFGPPVKYTGTSDIHANEYASDCPQQVGIVDPSLPLQAYNVMAGLNNINHPTGEDCLYINVWCKPQSHSKPKPVMVWLYGGSFQVGGTNTSLTNGQFFADNEDVVLVNFNYRVNMFGFPGAPGQVQNVGLLDQRMAIEWVRDNIAGFGGDPSRITLFGQSAGGASIDMYTYSFKDDPIIVGAIMESATAQSFGVNTVAHGQESWYNVTRDVGCGTNKTNTDEELLACMRSDKVTVDAILGSQGSSNLVQNANSMFVPTVDGKLVFLNYTEKGLRGDFLKVPILIGNNDHENGLSKQYLYGSGEQVPDSYWEQLDLRIWNCPASTVSEMRAARDVPTWRYRFMGVYPNEELPAADHRAWHGAEIAVLFGTSESLQVESTWIERQVGSWMRNAWASFARCPEHGLEGIGWKRYSNTTKSLLLIGKGNETVPSHILPSVYDGGCGPFPYPQNPPR